MAGKKMKKMAMKAVTAGNCDCASCGPFGKLEMYMLVFLGGLGLLNAFSWLPLGPNNLLFQYVWSVLVLVIGMTRLLGVKY